MGLWADNITDDRGQRVRMLRVVDLFDPASPFRYLDANAADLGARIRQLHEDNRRRYQWTLGCLAGVGWAIFMTGGVLLFMWTPVAAYTWMGLLTLTFLVLRPPLVRALRKPIELQLIDAALERRRCASCGYGLVGCPVESDGHVSCPECHAAWRADRLAAQLLPGMTVTQPSEPPAAAITLPVELTGLRALLPWLSRAQYGHDSIGRLVPLIDIRMRAMHGGKTVPARLVRAKASLQPAVRDWIAGSLLTLILAWFALTQVWTSFRRLRALPVSSGGTVTGAAIGQTALVLLTLVLTVLVACVFLAMIWRMVHRRTPTRIIDVMIEQELCPSCATDLKAVPLDATGRAKCPGCEAVW